MQTWYQYIRFAEVPSNGRTSAWVVINIRSGAEIGVVKWHGSWRGYCFFPAGMTIFSGGCLRDIRMFMEELTRDWKEQPAQREVQDGLVRRIG